MESSMSKRQINIQAGDCSVVVVLDNNMTADIIWESLPITTSGSTWGDEIYFRTDINLGEDNAKDVVDFGTVGFWPPGSAICLFFGPTPASEDNEIRPASPVNHVGWIDGDPKLLKSFRSGDVIHVNRL